MQSVRLGLILVLGVGLVSGSEAQQNVLRGKAVLRDTTGQEIGKVFFTQAPADHNLPTPGVDVLALAEGLTPGLHGIHIHENGSCDPGPVGGPSFLAAGGHFDPGPFGNSNPDANHPFHMGDLPNLEVNNGGLGHLRAVTTRITLSPGPLTVFDANGSSIIIHQNPDLGVTSAPGSGLSGGSRIACGVIEID